ncbi:MAG TPA: CPBP family intramembrane glutamic endopeptidase [Propionibacteriaceae bacterium]|nr:CPBP family intramembrane glutamic endopeptidase [Propionibacteriaceae bacterium]
MSAQLTMQRSRQPREELFFSGGTVAWRHVICFVLLAYGFAWAIWTPLAPAVKDALWDGRTPDNFAATPVVTFGMYAPALAAVVMRLLISKEGFRGAVGPRPSLRMALGAVLIPMALVLILVAIVTASDIGDATPGKPVGTLLAILTFVGVPVGAALAFGEEFGWRGYLLPKLLPLGEVKAAIIVGLIWGPWHLPVLIVGLNYPGQSILAVLVVFVLSATLLSLLHARFFVASGGSLLAVSLLHGSLNTFSDRLTDQNHLSGDPFIVSAGGLIASALLAAGLFIAYRVLARRKSSRPPTFTQPPSQGERS